MSQWNQNNKVTGVCHGGERMLIHSKDLNFNRNLDQVRAVLNHREDTFLMEDYLEELCAYCRKHGYVSDYNDESYYSSEQLDIDEAMLLYQLPFLFDRLYHSLEETGDVEMRCTRRHSDTEDHYYALEKEGEVYEFHCFFVNTSNTFEYFFVDAGTVEEYPESYAVLPSQKKKSSTMGNPYQKKK